MGDHGSSSYDLWDRIARRQEQTPMLPDLHRKETKVQAIESSGFLLGLATSDRHVYTDLERSSLWTAGAFLATIAGRADVIPPEPDWPTRGEPDRG